MKKALNQTETCTRDSALHGAKKKKIVKAAIETAHKK